MLGPRRLRDEVQVEWHRGQVERHGDEDGRYRDEVDVERRGDEVEVDMCASSCLSIRIACSKLGTISVVN